MCNYHSQSQKSTGKKSYAKNVKDDSINWRPISGLTGLEEALTLEKFVNRELISLAGQAKFHRDPHAKLVIEAEMEHQVDIIKEIADLVTRLRQYPPNKDYELGEYLLDRELSK
uniref:ferroxidase n=2 Tax=Arion vulgaris TaxID=1028688 RepID=A0A0B6ZTQ4_9EUPU